MQDEHRLLVMEQRLKALTALLLSHIVATDICLPGVQDSTIHMAQQDAREAAKRGPQLAFAFLNDMIDDLNTASGKFANDP